MKNQSLQQDVNRLDAAGDHDGAIDLLARATGSGDLHAMTRLGKRLMVGDRAPLLPRQGASMVLEAAQKGIAEAVATVSVMQCIGVFQEQSWPQALQTLIHAARLGWLPAREQLLLLNEAAAAGASGIDLGTQDADWCVEVGEGIDLDTWFRVGEERVLAEAPRIVSFPDFIPASWCRFFIRLSQHRLRPALVYDSANKRNFRSTTRTNTIAEFNLVENEFLHFLLQARMSRACKVPMQQMEGTAILHYSPGEKISNHYDFVDPELPHYEQEIRENGQRIITFLVYLNDAYAGGETAFPEVGISHRGQLGEGLYFVNALADGSPDTRTLHAGMPPESGEKWIVSQFIRNRPVRYVPTETDAVRA